MNNFSEMKSLCPCDSCRFMFTWIKNPNIERCISQCVKMNEYVTNKDGCTLGEIKRNWFPVFNG